MTDIRRFADLASAGRALAGALAGYDGQDDLVVLGVARGGVPAALEVSKALGAPMDVLILRRLLAGGEDGAQCVFNVAGTRVLDPALADPADPLLQVYLAEALANFATREQACRRARRPAELCGKTVMLVDNGVRTGGTLRAAIRAVRRLEPARIVAAVPFATADTREALESAADDVVCLDWHEWTGNVAMGYHDFTVPGLEQIGSLVWPGAADDDGPADQVKTDS